MRYLVIHSRSYGGEGPWRVDFEIEAESPEARVTGVFPGPDGSGSWVSDVTSLLTHEPNLTASDVARRTGGQYIGLLAEKHTGALVSESGDSQSDAYPPHWTTLNLPPLGEEPSAQLRSKYRKHEGESSEQWRHHLPRIVVLTGAGISAESGLSTFRDANGMWEQHRIEDVASPVAFAEDPDMVHRFYDARRAQLNEVQPNAAHWALSRLEAVFPGEVLIITQNVDDLHEAARSENVLHMHGRLTSALCASCGARKDHSGDLITRPACNACGERTLRPDIVWFGEQILEGERIFEAAKNCEVFVVIGTSGVVYPAADLVRLAAAHGAQTVLIDLDIDAHEDMYDLVYEGPASQCVPEWVREVMLRHGGWLNGRGERVELSGELLTVIDEFVEAERNGRSYNRGAGHTPQELPDLLAWLKIPAEQYRHHQAMCELEPLMHELLADDGHAGEGGNRALTVHMFSYGAATCALETQLHNARIEYAADLLAWLIADCGPAKQAPSQEARR